MRDGTRVIVAGRRPPGQGEPFAPGPVFASAYRLSGSPEGEPFTYGRFSNPTWADLETALGDLEGGDAVVFASGMAAVAAVFGSVLRKGDAVVLPSDSYYTVQLLAEGFFAGFGVEVRTAPTPGGGLAEELPGARLLWLESPTNPALDVCDIAELVDRAHAAGALVAVDNTTATALAQAPLALGADFSVASDTKALAGHSDLLLGHVAVRDPDLAEGLRRWRTQVGAIPGPMETWLAHRSLATLDLRLERMCANAQAIADWLSRHPAVRNVRYPGLPGDPAHPIAARQMRRFGHMLTFELADGAAAERFLAACTLVIDATSFGSVHTTAERRARWAADPVPEGFIRMSAGCEDARDLIEDLGRALGSGA